MDNKFFLENSPYVEKEFEDYNFNMDISETSISSCSVKNTDIKGHEWKDGIKEFKIVNDIKVESEADNIVISDNVKAEEEFNAFDIKIEFDNKLLFCDHCNVLYEDYCTQCRMLTHIFNGVPPSVTADGAMKELPSDILEIKESSGQVGVFALKLIPENVKIGPFNGLSVSECPWRLKGGKFLVSEDKLKLLNWMQYINPAKNIYQQNLLPFQCEDHLYYHTNREILAGEELLVYFGEEYEDCVNKQIEMDFIPPAEEEITIDVFACVVCCLGFSSKEYLAKHKSICPNGTDGNFSLDELTQCCCCNIYLDEKEYIECHQPYCRETNLRKSITPAVNNRTVEASTSETKLQMYNSQSEYETAYKNYLETHMRKEHREFRHECNICEYKTNGKSTLQMHIKTKHLQRFDYKCKACDYETNDMSHLQKHTKTKHLKEYNYKCGMCDFKTMSNCSLQMHIRTKHLETFNYNCEICKYTTNKKLDLDEHMKLKHLNDFYYKCAMCDYKSEKMSRVNMHLKIIHLQELNFMCQMCEYKTNRKYYLQNHVNSKHLGVYRYECKMCDYKTNRKSDFEKHISRKHFKKNN